jgi:hypothetical protein
MIAEFGERWPVEWLKARGLAQWAEYLDQHFPCETALAAHAIALKGHMNGLGFEAAAMA